MKMNKWTMGLAAAGVVSLSSVAQAQDAPATAEGEVSTKLSGYVSTGYKFNNGAANVGYFGAGGRNQFSLDVIDLKLENERGENDTAGYTVELWMGPAANDIGTGTDVGSASGVQNGTVELMQANIDVSLGGFDLKIGQMGSVVGAETYNYSTETFYTRSWAFAMEPTHHTGLLATKQGLIDNLDVSVGIANSTGAGIEDGSSNAQTKTALAAVSYTLPSTFGSFLTGTELYYGLVTGNANAEAGENTDYHYASVALPPLLNDALDVKVAWDHIEHRASGGEAAKTSDIVGLYLGYTLNDTTAINVRYEMGNLNSDTTIVTGGNGTASTLGTGNADNLQSLTVGVNHKIWDHVTSRIEYRHDEVDGAAGTDTTQDVVALNLIYTF